MRIIAQFLSYLFHPIFAPLVSVFILFQLPIYLNYKYPSAYFTAVYACIFFNLIIIPLSLSYYLKKQGMIQSLEMQSANERVYPYGLTLVLYCITYFLFSQIRFPSFYQAILLGAALSLLILFLFSLANYKISAHMTGLGGIGGMLLVTNQFYQVNTIDLLCLLLLISSLVASARLYLNRHTLGEVFLGFLNGFLCQMVLLL